MKRLLRSSLLVIFAVQLHAADSKQPTPIPTPNIHDVTKWSVTYWDGRLGEVKGTAYVNWGDGTARVVLKDPQTNSEKNLVASEIKATADELVMTLRGEGLSSARVTAPPNQGISELASGDDTKVRIEGGVGENEFNVKAKARADSNIARVALHRGAFGVLDGEWSYYADPITQRNSLGTGRVGWFRLLNREEIEQAHDTFGPINGGFVGRQSGREQWWPIPVELAAVEVIENQLISDERGPIFPAPTQEENLYARSWDDKVRTTWKSDTAKRRTLFVVGRNFPSEQEEAWPPISPGGGSALKLISRWKQSGLSDEIKQKFEIGWAKVLAESPTEKQSINREMDAALFEVTLRDGVLPGPKTFEFGAAQKQWLLQFGDNRAEARFVRPLKEVQSNDATSVNELEASQTFYLPERVAVEVQTRIELPFDQLRIRVGTSRSKDAVQVFSARRVSPGLYRTEFFKIGAESGGIAAKEGDELLATVDHRDLLDNSNFQFVGAVSTKARLLLTPGSRELGKLGGLWKGALLRAAKLAGKENLSLDALPGAEAEYFTFDSIAETAAQHAVTAGVTAVRPKEKKGGIRITVGDHAAMLLLREVFVEKMKAQLDWIDGLRTDDDVQKFRDWVEPFLSGDSHAYYAQPQSPYASVKYPSWLSFIPDSDKNDALKKIDDLNETLAGMATALKIIPGLMLDAASGGRLKKYATRWGRGSAFAQIEVKGPDGSAAPFYEAFDQYNNPFANSFKNEAARRQWQLDATKEAIGKYREVVKKAKENVEKIEDSDRKELLKLTGIGFGAVIHDLLPRLMKLETFYTVDREGKKTQLSYPGLLDLKKSEPTLNEATLPHSQLWLPDNVGRYAVCNLATTQQAVLGQEEYVKILDQYALIVATAVLSVPAMVSEAAVASVVGLAGNTLLWGATSLQEIVDTYKSRQDVQFEFGYAIVVGPERLAEAEAKKQEWFSTLASIIANGAFVTVQAKFDTLPKVEKEMAVFRGRKICDAKQMQGNVKWFAGLNKDQASDVMAYLEEGNLRNYTARAMPIDDAAKLYKAKCAGHEARGPPEPKKLPVVENPKPGSVAGSEEPKGGFHGAKTEPIPEGPAGEGPAKPGFHDAQTQPITEAPPEEPKAKPGLHEGQTQPITEAPPGEPKAKPGLHEGHTQPITEGPAEEPKPKSEEPKAQSEEPLKTAATNVPLPPSESLAKPDLPDVGKPATGSWFCAREKGNEVHYLLGKKLGDGGSSDVFLIEDVKGRDKAFLKDGAVIKIIRGDTLMGDPNVQIKRMWAISERLKKTRIKFAEILEAHSEAERPYLIQKQVKFDKDRMMIDVGELANIKSPFGYVIKDYEELVKLFPEAQQEAVLKLYRQLADEGLVATDISLTNIYFERAGNGWEAAILDIDFILDWKKTLNAGQEVNKKTVSWVQQIVANPAERIRIDEFTEPLKHGITSVLIDGRKIQNAHDFMEKMLEFHYAGTGKDGWIEFDEGTKQFKARLINPDLIEKHFPNFRKDLSTKPAVAAPVKKSGASAVPVRMRWQWPGVDLPQFGWRPTFALAA